MSIFLWVAQLRSPALLFTCSEEVLLGELIMDEERYCVYILQNPAGKFYVGSTNNIDRRLQEHNSEYKVGRKFTHKNGPWELIYKEHFDSRSDAMSREKFIKSRKSSQWIRKYLLKEI